MRSRRRGFGVEHFPRKHLAGSYVGARTIERGTLGCPSLSPRSTSLFRIAQRSYRWAGCFSFLRLWRQTQRVKFDSKRNILSFIGSMGTNNGQFQGPSDAAIDSQGNIYGLDYFNFPIQKFDSKGRGLCMKSRWKFDWRYAAPTVIGRGRIIAICVFALLSMVSQSMANDAQVFWHSQPVKPGQTVLIYGDELADARVIGGRLGDGPAGMPGENKGVVPGFKSRPLTIIQARKRALKAILPDEAPGVYALMVGAGQHSQRILVNAPQVWWARGAHRLNAVPGEDLRLFGLGLGWRGVHEPLAGKPPKNLGTRIVLQGPRTTELVTADADLYSARAPLPKDLPEGEYIVWVHNGCGGTAAWGRCLEPLRIVRPDSWPTTEYNVLRFGARGDGVADDTDAVQAALDTAGRAGGGVIYCPSGQYRFNRPLRIPRWTLLRGESRDKTLFYWSNRHFARLRGIIHGEAHFGLEDLTIWYVGAEHGIENMAEVEGKDLYSNANRPSWWQEGDIRLRRLVIRWSPYGARPGWGQLSDTIELTRQLNFESLDAAGKGVAIWLCGRDIRVEDCDVYSGGFPLLLAFMSDGSLVRNNVLRTGRGGLVWAQRGRKVIWENNQMLGSDNLSRAGWSTKAHPYYDQVYFRGNTVAFAQSADYEIVGSDGASPVYYGGVAPGGGTQVQLKRPVRSWPFEPAGHLAFVLAGKGKGQARTIVRGSTQSIELERPWQVPLDETSLLGINHSLRQWLMVGNQIADGDSMQMYGLNHEVVFAENRLERVGGSSEAALRFLAFQHTSDGPEAAEPSFFSQMLGNHLVAHRMDLRRFESGTAAVELSGGDVDSLGDVETPCLMNAAVLRGNRIQGGKILISVGSQKPFRAEDILIEDNVISDAPVGIEIGGRTAGIMMRRNSLAAVREPLRGEGIRDAWLEPGMRVRNWLSSLDWVGGRLAHATWPATYTRIARAVQMGRQEDSEVVLGELQRLVAPMVIQAIPPPHHADLARVLFSVQVEVQASASLEKLLDTGAGGSCEVRVQFSNAGIQKLQCRVEPVWPRGWQAGSGTVEAPAGRSTTLRLPVVLPPGSRGSYTFPAQITIQAGESVVSWQESIPVGTGAIQEWRVLGPFAADAMAASTLANTARDAWNLQAPVKVGNAELFWRSITNTSRLKLSEPVPAGQELGTGMVGAYALCAVEADADLWAEVTVGSGAPGGKFEVQFYLDGKELWDLRLGRETWSPKRLPLRMNQGRHFLLVVARDQRVVPDVSISIRELGLPSGGRVRPVAPNTIK